MKRLFNFLLPRTAGAPAAAAPSKPYPGIDPLHATATAVSQLQNVLQHVSGGDLTIELAITHTLHEIAKARYFTVNFPAANSMTPPNVGTGGSR